MQAIVSTTANWCLGVGSTIPWFDQEETRRFRSLTLGGTCVMGRKTYEANYPWMRGVRKVVLSRNVDLELPGALVCNTITEIAGMCPDAWVVGGPMALQAFLPYVQHMFLTKFPTTAQGDVWLPEISWSMWVTRGKTVAHGRELLMLERRAVTRSQHKPGVDRAPVKHKDEAKTAK